jgi:hypothetical protein
MSIRTAIRFEGARLASLLKNSELGGQVSGPDLGRADTAFYFSPEPASADDRALAQKSFSAASSGVLSEVRQDPGFSR